MLLINGIHAEFPVLRIAKSASEKSAAYKLCGGLPLHIMGSFLLGCNWGKHADFCAEYACCRGNGALELDIR